MPKDGDRRVKPLSSNRVSPYSCSSNGSNSRKLGTSSAPSLDEREWEETRCPICMEHPHNAVMLICSSREKGCHPYMCDTSYRHSNCLDQFCKSFPAAASTAVPEDESVTRVHNHRGRSGQRSSQSKISIKGQGLKLVCPLCRGQSCGWVVVESARKYMNSKRRSCSLESCEFRGNYAELRKHARSEHPSFRPTEPDPQRQSDWVRLERQRDLGDTLSANRQDFIYDWDQGDLLDDDLHDFAQDELTIGLQPEEENLFDQFFSGIHSEAENEESDHGDLLIDLNSEIEFSFSFLSDLSFLPWGGDRNLGSTRTSGSLSSGRRSTRSSHRAAYEPIEMERSRHRVAYEPIEMERDFITASRNATMRSRERPNSSQNPSGMEADDLL